MASSCDCVCVRTSLAKKIFGLPCLALAGPVSGMDKHEQEHGIVLSLDLCLGVLHLIACLVAVQHFRWHERILPETLFDESAFDSTVEPIVFSGPVHSSHSNSASGHGVASASEPLYSAEPEPEAFEDSALFTAFKIRYGSKFHTCHDCVGLNGYPAFELNARKPHGPHWCKLCASDLRR